MPTQEERLRTVEYGLNQFKTETIKAYQDMAMETIIVKGLGEDSIKRLTRLQTTMDQRFDTVNQRFDTVDQRFNTVEQRFNTVNQRFDTVDQRFDTVEQRLGTLEQDMRDVKQRLSNVEGLLGQILERLPKPQ